MSVSQAFSSAFSSFFIRFLSCIKLFSFFSRCVEILHDGILNCIVLAHERGHPIRQIPARERDKREKSEEKIDCHHQDSNQGPSLVASDALTTELWCSRHPSRGRSTFSSDFVTHTSCESTQAGGTQPSL